MAVEPAMRAGSLARAGISDLEPGFSARSADEWNTQMEAVRVFELVETTVGHMRRGRQVQRLPAGRHHPGRKLPKLLIAAAAEVRNLVESRYCADFDKIAAVTSQPTEWVVLAGSID
ncbi:MAG TPA: PIN domain nuclease [Chloroflexota bacterium]|nr:PIN domain nuclease [Chloroflexota bacterium]